MAICKLCKTDGLVWKSTEGRWKLYYSSGDPHLCRPTREKLAKKIQRRLTSEEFWNMPQLLKWEASQPKPEPIPPEALWNYTHPWFSFLDAGDPRPKSKKSGKVLEDFVP